MVTTTSTRGGSEGLLGVLVWGVAWAVDKRKPLVAGKPLGLELGRVLENLSGGISPRYYLAV